VLACGFLVADIVVADLERVAGPGEVVHAPRGIQLHVGGHPANVSIDLVKLGVPAQKVGVCGAVGRDLFGDFIEGVLRSYGLQVYVQRVDAPTNKNVILVVRGEDRRFHVELGASRLLPPEVVVELASRLRPRIFYLASGITDRVDERIEEVFRAAAGGGALTFADLVQPFGKGWEYIVPALPHVSVLHCNREEAAGLTGLANPLEAARRILGWGVDLALVTFGAEGALAAAGGVAVVQKGFEVEVVDPTGAGDAFCAGVMLKLLELGLRPSELAGLGWRELAELLAFAQAVGAAACTAPGTTEGVSRERVEELLRRQREAVLSSTRVERLG